MINKKVAGLVLAVGLLGGVVGNAVAPREEVKYIGHSSWQCQILNPPSKARD